MSDKPEALRLAGAIHCGDSACKCSRNQAATELRRLHEVNQELLEALETLAEHFEYYMGDNECRPLENARSAIAKATGENT